MKKYKEVKSRNSVTKDFGGKVEVKTKIPKNTCHPGAKIEFHSLATPPRWKCAQCGGMLLIEKPVNTAVIAGY